MKEETKTNDENYENNAKKRRNWRMRIEKRKWWIEKKEKTGRLRSMRKAKKSEQENERESVTQRSAEKKNAYDPGTDRWFSSNIQIINHAVLTYKKVPSSITPKDTFLVESTRLIFFIIFCCFGSVVPQIVSQLTLILIWLDLYTAHHNSFPHLCHFQFSKMFVRKKIYEDFQAYCN